MERNAQMGASEVEKLFKSITLKQDKEVWLRGATIDGVTPLLQPVAYALLQAGEEINALMENFPDHLLNTKPSHCASAGFHLLHIAGVLDRLLTYAEKKSLTEEQLNYLSAESQPHHGNTGELVKKCTAQITITIKRLAQFSPEMLAEHRAVGRAALPSTVIGLCTHAAEHTMRHLGQLLVTTRVLINP